MQANAYQLNFPCPECGGMLTMCVKNGEGNCPICQSTISVNLEVRVSEPETDETPRRGWDNRAFRRPTTTNKPMWQPLHQPSE